MDEGSSLVSSQSGSVASFTNVRKVITLNVHGQPIGEHSTKLATKMGEFVRTHIPITYADWRLVPTYKKDELWNLLLEDFDIPQSGKSLCLKAMSEAWRKNKAKLRKSNYDPYTNDADRVQNCPPTVKMDDWAKFVAQTSSPKAAVLRQKNKKIRKSLTIYHKTGRLGYARVEETMKQEFVDGAKPITRSGVWLRAHTVKDNSNSSSAEPKVEKIRELLSSQCEGNSQNILNDPLARVFGPDKRGRVRGVGTTVSRKQMLGSAPAIDKLLQKEREVKNQHDDIQYLKKQVTSLTSAMREINETIREIKSHIMPSSTPTYESPSTPTDASSCSKMPMRDSSSTESPLEDSTSMKEIACELLNWMRKVVAIGRAISESRPSTIHGRLVADDDVKVIVDIIYVPDTLLHDPNSFASTLGDVGIGGCVSWPKSYIRQWP